MDSRDVRMVQRGERLRFTLEPSKSFGVLGERLWQYLDRDLATEARIGGTIDFALRGR